jgi:hypothetical protein
MKSFLKAEEQPLHSTDDVNEKPAPYNWLLMLIILIAYMLFAFIL